MTVSSSTSNNLASLLSGSYSSSSGSSSSSSATGTTTGSLITTGVIDVNSLVSQLVAADSVPLRQLQSQVSGVQSQLSAYGQLQSSASSLQTAVQKLTFGSAFSAEQATTSGSGVAAAVSGSPLAGSYSVTVSQLAQAQSAASAPVSSTTAGLGTGTLTIQLGTYNATGNAFTPKTGASAVNITIDSTNNTLSGIASAINSSGAGVSASIVTDNAGSRLVLTSTATGTANGFKMTVADGDGNNLDANGLSQFAFDPTATAGAGKNMTATQTGQDAQFSVNGLSLTSSSNIVTSAINGLTLTLNEAPPAGSTLQSQITVGSDTSSVSSSVNDFVSAFNSLVKLEQSLTAYNSTTNTSSVLTGDLTARSLVSQLSSILGGQLSGGSSGYGWLASVGIDFNKDGTLTLNSTKFASAMAANPQAVTKMFSSVAATGASAGFATQLNTALDSILGPNGLLTDAQSAKQSSIKTMNRRVSEMQNALTQEQTQLTAQYSQLNADLVKAQQEQSNLASALSGIVAA